MKRLVVSFSHGNHTILVEGESVLPSEWSLDGQTVRLHLNDGSVFAEGMLGLLGPSYLSAMSFIKVSALNLSGRVSKWLPRRELAA